MSIKIYDVDGTLTKVIGEVESESFDTFAFWPLISYHFAKDPLVLRIEAEQWDRSDKGVDEAFIKSSHDMLESGIRQFKEGVSAQAVRAHAKKITLQFVEQDIIRIDAIEHLKKSVEMGDVCILSTGSYYDGAMGFVDALIEKGLLPDNAHEKLIVSGALINWEERVVVHANIAANKISGIENACKEKLIEFQKENITGIYVDDPLGNDSGLCQLNSNAVRCIETKKNENLKDQGITLTNWPEINSRDFPAIASFRR